MQKEESPTLEQRLDVLEREVQLLKRKTTNIGLTLENDTNKKISTLFDGLMDHIRYRNIAKETVTQTEELKMRIGNLETVYQSIIYNNQTGDHTS